MSETGSIEVLELPAIEAHQHHAAEQISERFLYRWSPPRDLIQKLPAGYSVALECWHGRDGVRRFTPANPKRIDFHGYTSYDLPTFALEASIGGHALLWRRGEVAPFRWLPYGVARLFMQYAQHLREHLGPTRELSDALHICVAARKSRGEMDALPADIGLNDKGEGERWNAARLMEEGRLVAKARGITLASEDETIRLGLLAAAELSPLEMSDAESEFITRSTIFLLNSELPPPSNELLKFVAIKISDSIDKKQDVSNEEFRKWIEDPHSSLIRSIQRASNDKLGRKEIRAALLELAWLSIKMFGTTVDALMRDFREAIPEKLSPIESRLYGQAYLSNAVFGGLPLVLLHDRWPLLTEVIPDLWDTPEDPRSVAKVRTILYFYGVIVGSLRESDKLYKRRARPRAHGKSTVREESLPEHAAVAPTASVEIIHDVIRKLAIERGLISPQAADEWTILIASFDDTAVTTELIRQTPKEVVPLVVDRATFDCLVKEAMS